MHSYTVITITALSISELHQRRPRAVGQWEFLSIMKAN